MSYYCFDLDLSGLGSYKLKQNSISFEKEVSNRFDMLLSRALDNDLKRISNGKRVVYVHKGSGVPLLGYHAFGIVDRGSSIVEVRPLTGCNLDCIYCSVDEGKSSKKAVDFLVEPDYLVEEVEKLLNFKKIPCEVHVGVQGEPLLYSKLTYLIDRLSKLKYCKLVSIETNAVLLTKEKVDELIKAGLGRISLSIDAVDEKIAKKLNNSSYSVRHSLDIAEYISSKNIHLIIAPVWVPGFNDKEIPKLIKFSKKIDAMMGIQNFLEYKRGRKPAKQKPWDKFYDDLKKLEKEFDVRLVLSRQDFDIVDTPVYPKPFKKGDVVKPDFICPGRLSNEWIAVYKDRCISVLNCFKKGKVKILRDKDNIFVGKCV
jgi:uncharacterized Fe-S cluster-containing radical SAM superfamily enzyme